MEEKQCQRAKVWVFLIKNYIYIYIIKNYIYNYIYHIYNYILYNIVIVEIGYLSNQEKWEKF